jgi:hypothetical protein
MSPRSSRVALSFLAAFLLGFLVSCSVSFTDEVRYACKADTDCGGDGFVCTPAGTRICCKPSGAEICDKKDNDCDGFADNTGKLETCNGEDDDCNGVTDDGFDKQTNVSHCGACNNACAPRVEFCRGGQCIVRLESLCFDGFDDDGNGKTDCEDPSCDKRACGAACVCQNLKKAEDLCTDGIDNEGDNLTDCLDPDCTGKTCRSGGCTCVADGGQFESDCTDGLDNDNDALADCLDTDCVAKFCTPPDIYFTCTGDQKCRCNGGVQIAEVGSVLCRDGVDNDCDGEFDCDEDSCTGQSCVADGGMGCECFMGRKKETSCVNLVDDDGDSLVDCADSDCLMGTTCTRPDGGGAGACGASSTCD